MRKYKEISIENLFEIILDFYNEHGEFPNHKDFGEGNLIASIDYEQARKLAINSYGSLNKLYCIINPLKAHYYEREHYFTYVNHLKNQISENKLTFSYVDLNSYAGRHGNPNMSWFINNCPNLEVKTEQDFFYWIGLEEKYDMYHILDIPIDKAKNYIRERISRFVDTNGRNVRYDDFRGDGLYGIRLQIIKNIWGTTNKMLEDLGYEIEYPEMASRKANIKIVEKIVKTVCETVYKNEGRQIISVSDFIPKNGCFYSDNLIHRYLSKYRNMSTGEYVKTLGYDFVKSGSGLNYITKDKEKIYSRYENMFSKYLNELGLTYNIDYKRDVKYTSFSDSNKNYNCDYCISYMGRTIYVEIAGLLGEYKKWYYDNRIIDSSKSKEKYRKDLMAKERLLLNSGVEYFILFDCDITKEFIYEILNGDYETTKDRINKFYVSNIVWKLIDVVGELQYETRDSKFGDKKIVVPIYNTEEVS